LHKIIFVENLENICAENLIEFGTHRISVDNWTQ